MSPSHFLQWTLTTTGCSYTASFTNDVGYGTVDLDLTVYFGPYFSYEREEQVDGATMNVTFAGGQNLTLICNVSATNPAVSSLVLRRPEASNVDFEEGTGTITITGATTANEGNYTCTANNGETTPTTIMFVLRMDSPPSSASLEDGEQAFAVGGGQVFAVYVYQLAGFGVAPALFILLLLILTVLLVYVLTARKRVAKATSLV